MMERITALVNGSEKDEYIMTVRMNKTYLLLPHQRTKVSRSDERKNYDSTDRLLQVPGNNMNDELKKHVC